MVDWNTNEAGTVHRAGAAVRGSRFLREAVVIRKTQVVLEGEEIYTSFEASIFSNTDMEAAINAGLKPRKTIMEVKYFDTLRRAKAWAETWLQH